MRVNYKIRTTILCSTLLYYGEIKDDEVDDFKLHLMDHYNEIVENHKLFGKNVTGAIFFIGSERYAVGSCQGRYKSIQSYIPKSADDAETKLKKITNIILSEDYTEKGCIKEIKKILGIN